MDMENYITHDMIVTSEITKAYQIWQNFAGLPSNSHSILALATDPFHSALVDYVESDTAVDTVLLSHHYCHHTTTTTAVPNHTS